MSERNLCVICQDAQKTNHLASSLQSLLSLWKLCFQCNGCEKMSTFLTSLSLVSLESTFIVEQYSPYPLLHRDQLYSGGDVPLHPISYHRHDKFSLTMIILRNGMKLLNRTNVDVQDKFGAVQRYLY